MFECGKTKEHITGLYQWDGREWIAWEDAGGCLHVTDGMIDMIMKRTPAIDRFEMLDKLQRYQPESPLIGLLQKKRAAP